jgi:hypothetical protein
LARTALAPCCFLSRCDGLLGDQQRDKGIRKASALRGALRLWQGCEL